VPLLTSSYVSARTENISVLNGAELLSHKIEKGRFWVDPWFMGDEQSPSGRRAGDSRAMNGRRV
jgi:hypothetical protein